MRTTHWTAMLVAACLATQPMTAMALDVDPSESAANTETIAPAERPEKPPIVLVESGPFKMKDKRGYRNIIIVGPRLIPPGIGGRYIRSVDEHISVMVGGGYAGWSLFGATVRHVDARAGIDYQPIGNGMHGFYVGPRVVYRSFLGAAESDGQTGGLHTRTLGAGGVIGWRAIWNPGLSLGAGIGATFTSALARAGNLSDSGNEGVELTGLLPSLELTAGFAF